MCGATCHAVCASSCDSCNLEPCSARLLSPSSLSERHHFPCGAMATGGAMEECMVSSAESRWNRLRDLLVPMNPANVMLGGSILEVTLERSSASATWLSIDSSGAVDSAGLTIRERPSSTGEGPPTVTRVMEGSPAEQDGRLRSGDVIFTIDDKPTHDMTQLKDALASSRISSLHITAMRLCESASDAEDEFCTDKSKSIPSIQQTTPPSPEDLTVDTERSSQADERGAPETFAFQTCPICLETPTDKSDVHVLDCSHAFCRKCLTQYSAHQGGRHLLPCPCCKRQVMLPMLRLPPSQSFRVTLPPTSYDSSGDGEEMAAMRERRQQARLEVRQRSSPVSGPLNQDDVRALTKAARHVPLRLCPSCSAPIVKNGGCENMRCLCGHSFRWYQAAPLRPCRHCHVEPGEGWLGRWQTCTHCSGSAKAEAAAAKAATASALIPAGAVVASVGVAAAAVLLGIGAVVAIVPAATIGPFAIAYEPVRRLRKKKTNPLFKPAISGALVAGTGMAMAVIGACGYESD